MLQAIFDQIQERMQQQIQERFGLSSDQTTQSTNILFENFRKFFSEDIMNGNMENLKGMMSSGIQNLKDNPALQKVRQNVMNDLVNKAGLSEEQAQKIQDFQVSELIAVIQSEFFDEQGKPDMQKIMSKVNLQEIQAKAKEMLGGFDLGKLFK
jgi:hypothetical protein